VPTLANCTCSREEDTNLYLFSMSLFFPFFSRALDGSRHEVRPDRILLQKMRVIRKTMPLPFFWLLFLRLSDVAYSLQQEFEQRFRFSLLLPRRGKLAFGWEGLFSSFSFFPYFLPAPI